MIHDLHAHTYYSLCGRDHPRAVCDAALRGGIQVLGITDHNYGITPARFDAYRAEIGALKDAYAPSLRILCGIEICTVPPIERTLPDNASLEGFDYCLVEHLDHPDSILHGDIISFAEKRACPVGIAHTDLFGFCQSTGRDPAAYLASLAASGIFWELNVNYDSIHHYREHAYVKAFFESPEQQEILRQSGLRLSIGFDGHRVEDYAPSRVIAAHKACKARALPLITPGE